MGWGYDDLPEIDLGAQATDEVKLGQRYSGKRHANTWAAAGRQAQVPIWWQEVKRVCREADEALERSRVTL